MSSTSLPATVGQCRSVETTTVDLESAFTIEGSHIRACHETLVEAIRALQDARFDSTERQIQLFAALWRQIRPQVYDAAVRVVRYAQEFAPPMLVLEDLSFCGAPLWERRTADDVGAWLLPALQNAIAVKTRDGVIPVTYVGPKYTIQQCHICGDLGSGSQGAVESTTEDCPVGTVSRDESTVLSIAQRARFAETTELIHQNND